MIHWFQYVRWFEFSVEEKNVISPIKRQRERIIEEKKSILKLICDQMLYGILKSL